MGIVSEEVRLIGPRDERSSGPRAQAHGGRDGPHHRARPVDNAVFDETGTYVASFIIDEAIVGEIDFPVYVQSAAEKLPKETEDGLEVRRDLGNFERGGTRCTAPSGSRTRTGRSTRSRSESLAPRSQTVRGFPTRSSSWWSRAAGRDTSLEEFWAAQRRLEGAEWAAAAPCSRTAQEQGELTGRVDRGVGGHGRHHRAHAERLELSLAASEHASQLREHLMGNGDCTIGFTASRTRSGGLWYPAERFRSPPAPAARCTNTIPVPRTVIAIGSMREPHVAARSPGVWSTYGSRGSSGSGCDARCRPPGWARRIKQWPQRNELTMPPAAVDRGTSDGPPARTVGYSSCPEGSDDQRMLGRRGRGTTR